MIRRNIAWGVFGAAALCALGACAPDFDPPPDYQGGFLMNGDRSRTVVVQPGDTLYVISRRYDVPSRIIADRNGLQPPYALTVGQTLILDPARLHTVGDTETLQSIAQRYNVDASVLAAANELSPPYRLRAGQSLWIPDPFTNASAAPIRAAANTRGDELPPVMTAPRNNRPITSESLAPIGGTASAPAAAPSVPVPAPSQLLSAPVQSQPLSSPVQPQPQPYTPPTETPAPAPVAAASATPTPPVPAPPIPVPTPPVSAPSAAPPPPAETNVAIAVPQSAVTEPAARASSRFSWPVNGKLVARFGPAGKGLHNDGINIAAPAGTQVRAADNGVVAYAGNELKGFGNLLLIKHADGWTTAYAHNDKLLVQRGDKVAQGQVIATVGKTGNVDSPQLHFEVRKGTQALDPLEYLVKTGG